jgi:type I restriction enzyme S subunit
MIRWEVTKLGEVIDTLKGAAFKSSLYVKEGKPIVRVSNFTDDSISSDEIFYYSLVDAANYSKYQLNHWDILIQTVGSWQHNPASIVGKVVKVPKELDKALLNQNIVKLIPTLKIDNKFLFYRLKDESFKVYILSCAQGAANHRAEPHIPCAAAKLATLVNTRRSHPEGRFCS